MLKRVLVANRAEIASRVFRTCRRLGIETVAVHSDADSGLPYVRESDVSVRLPGSAPPDTYLRIDLLVDAAVKAGADAVHPGYGFLSENADFARAVRAAGLTWIGPTPESIEVMGSKIEAKRIMREADVPVLEAPPVPSEADFPLLVKASAGGGGRGMRVVRRPEDLSAEVAAAQAEALSAFGDGTVFVEPYVERGRHVEVQVWGDLHGNIAVLGERDCSIQRRHQKVVEEAPAPNLPDEVRSALHDAARRAAEEIDYRGAGTVEFLYDPESQRFWFLEMNTRLQVEHPVTEAVFHVDLVAMQLGALLPVEPVEPQGHAIEVRLYAEDPAAGYAPQAGVLTRFDIPEGDGIRVDAGYESGSSVSTFYDAMLAKVVCHAPTREAAARKLADTLARARIHGVTTNRDQLVAVLRSEAFLAGEVSTAFLSSGLEAHSARTSIADPAMPVAAAIAIAEQAGAERTVQRGIPVGWRNVPSQPHSTEFTDGTVVEWSRGRDGYVVRGGNHSAVEVRACEPRDQWAVTLETDSVRTTYDVTIASDPGHQHVDVDVDGPTGHTRLTRRPRFTDPADAVASGSLLAPMPGTVVSVEVEKGVEVTAGEPILVLEAMKMQHTVAAPHDGVVTQVDVQPGQQVAAGEVLAVVAEPGG